MKSSHFDNKGSARMVDVSSKKISKRIAIACSKIFMKKNPMSPYLSNNVCQNY